MSTKKETMNHGTTVQPNATTLVRMLLVVVKVVLMTTSTGPSASSSSSSSSCSSSCSSFGDMFATVEGFTPFHSSRTLTRTARTTASSSTTTGTVTTTSPMLAELTRTVQHNHGQRQRYGPKQLKNMVLQSSSTTSLESAETGTDPPPPIISDEEVSSSSASPSEQQRKPAAGDSGRPRPISYNQEELETKFPNFPRTYVPLSSTKELDPNRPTPVEVFGQRYVVFQNPTSKLWTVMDDTCPHRLAPLSEGRIILPTPSSNKGNDKKKKKKKDDDDRNESSSSSSLIGNIQCSYHGWTFSSEGQCTSIPQASSDVERAALQQSTSCQVPTYSTIVDRSVIWFWPWKQDVVEATLTNAASSSSSSSSKNNDNNDDGWDITPSGLTKGLPSGEPSSTYTRELPYSYDILVENLLDPSHVPFAHHGLQGSRSDAIPIEMSIPTKIEESGFSFNWTDRTMGMMRRGEGRWQAPFTVLYDAKFYEQEPQKDFNLAVLCIPVRPGWSRAILFGPGSKDESSNDTDSLESSDDDDDSSSAGDDSLPATAKKTSPSSSSPVSLKTKLIRAIFSSIPVWVFHQLNSRFLDSDLAFLHFQELERSRRQTVISAATSPSKKSAMNGAESYFMPAASDRCISALRSWFTKYTDNMSGFGPLERKELTKSELFDRWTQHTSKCIHCQNGLKQLAKTRKILFGITALSLFGLHVFVFAKILFLVSLAAQPLIKNIENSFKEGGFKHYENH